MTEATAPGAARPYQRRFWHAYGVTMRPYLLFVSGITGIAGMSLVDDVPLGSLTVLGAVFFVAYGLGQALTDCFQTDTDSLSAPYRPLVRGVIRPAEVCVVSFLGLGACTVVLVAHHPATLLPAGLTVVGLLTYTWFKRRWWAGPWYNAWIVSLVVLLGYQAASGAAAMPARAVPALVGIMFVSFTAYANFVLAGYFKDVEPDRRTGYQTLPVVFGRRCSAWVSDGLAVAALAGSTVALHDVGTDGLLAAAPLFGGAVAATVLAQTRLHGVDSDAMAHRAIAPVVHAYLLLLAALAVARHPPWLPVLALYYLAFVGVLGRRPMAAQI
jgi:4-hydroxybenzoate polyprenyltransferase